MGIFDIFNGQAVDVIRWENPNPETLIWKWDQELDEIKNNSSLIVDPGLAAIFVRNGKIESIQLESGKWTLESENVPIISSLKNIMSGFETHEKLAVYFIKINQIANQKWGTPNDITYIDPQYNFPVELRTFGNFTFKIGDVENFWMNYVANSAQVSTDDVRMLITDRIIGNIATLFAQKKISYNEIDAHTMEITKELLEATKEEFTKLGLELSDFRIEDINFTDKTNEFIDKITSKKADVGAINATANIDGKAMDNYKQLENLDIMKEAAGAGGAAGDMMGAGMGMGMGMNMMNQVNGMNAGNQTQTQPAGDDAESKLVKIKGLFDKGLITEEEYSEKKGKILEKM